MTTPLFPHQVTRASRIMLPMDVLVSLWIGLSWILQDDTRTRIPALYSLRGVWPIWASGVVLLTFALLQILALLTHKRAACAIAVGSAGAIYVIFAGFVIAPLFDGNVAASFSGPAWPFYVAVAHFATVASLSSDEYTDVGATNRRAT